jgi:hypothetical protein
MIARLNFLFAVSILTVLLFYFVGRFVILQVILASAPALAPYFSAAYALAALMLTVLVLAKTVIRLGPVSTVVRYRKAGMRSGVAQVALYLAHLCTLFAAYTMFSQQDVAAAWWPWVLAALLYAGGIAATMAEWRRLAMQAQ